MERGGECTARLMVTRVAAASNPNVAIAVGRSLVVGISSVCVAARERESEAIDVNIPAKWKVYVT
jgi:hypothetical protein